jgi:hypothetical protein
MRLWERLLEFVTVVTALGCGTGVIITTVDKVFGSRRKERELALRQAAERERLQTREIAALRQENVQLQKQVEWHARLLEADGRRGATRVTAAAVHSTEVLLRER